MVNADLRAAEIMKRTVNIDFPSIAEIGVYKGDMSRRLMFRTNLHLVMIDPWGDFIAETYKSDPLSNHSVDEWEIIKKKAMDGVAWASDRVRVYQGTSEGAAEYFNEQFDVVFIDGDHSYEATSKDIALWWPKVAPGGYLGGHDFGRPEFGVTEAVTEFADEIGLEVVLGQNYTWFIQNPIMHHPV